MRTEQPFREVGRWSKVSLDPFLFFDWIVCFRIASLRPASEGQISIQKGLRKKQKLNPRTRFDSC